MSVWPGVSFARFSSLASCMLSAARVARAFLCANASSSAVLCRRSFGAGKPFAGKQLPDAEPLRMKELWVGDGLCAERETIRRPGRQPLYTPLLRTTNMRPVRVCYPASQPACLPVCQNRESELLAGTPAKFQRRGRQTPTGFVSFVRAIENEREQESRVCGASSVCPARCSIR